MLVAHQNIAISAVWNILLFAPLDRYFWPQCALPLPLLLSVGYVCMSAAAGKQFNVARCMASKSLKPAQAVLCSPGVSVLGGPAALLARRPSRAAMTPGAELLSPRR